MDPMNPEAVAQWLAGDDSCIDDMSWNWDYDRWYMELLDREAAVEALACQRALNGRQWSNVKDGMPTF